MIGYRKTNKHPPPLQILQILLKHHASITISVPIVKTTLFITVLEFIEHFLLNSSTAVNLGHLVLILE